LADSSGMCSCLLGMTCYPALESLSITGTCWRYLPYFGAHIEIDTRRRFFCRPIYICLETWHGYCVRGFELSCCWRRTSKKTTHLQSLIELCCGDCSGLLSPLSKISPTINFLIIDRCLGKSPRRGLLHLCVCSQIFLHVEVKDI
jgi:hypothetical protein